MSRIVDRARSLETRLPAVQQAEQAAALLLVAAMLAFIGALVCFLREIFLATANLRIGSP